MKNSQICPSRGGTAYSDLSVDPPPPPPWIFAGASNAIPCEGIYLHKFEECGYAAWNDLSNWQFLIAPSRPG